MRDPDADVGAAVRSREDPAVARERLPGRRLEHRNHGRLDRLGVIAPHGEAPQHSLRLHQAREGRHPAGGTVGADHEVGSQRSPAGVEAFQAAFRPQGFLGPTFYEEGAGVTRSPLQGGVEVGPPRRHSVPRVGESGGARKADPPPGRAYDDHGAEPRTARQGQAEVVEELHAAWSDEIAAGLIAGKGGLVEQGHPGARSSQHHGGDAPGRAGADDQDVESGRRHRASPSVARGGSAESRAGSAMLFDRDGHHRRRNRFAQQLFAPLPERYDLLAEVLSLGQNGRWRRRHGRPDRARRPGLGSSMWPRVQPAWPCNWRPGRPARWSASTSLWACCSGAGGDGCAALGLTERIPLVTGRAEQLPFPDASFDALTFTYLLRYVDDPEATLLELGRVVKPGGTMASLDFLPRPEPFWRAWWWGYTRRRPPRGRPGHRRPAVVRVGRFLGPNISEHYRRYPVASIVGGLAPGRIRRRPGPPHEPRWRAGHDARDARP